MTKHRTMSQGDVQALIHRCLVYGMVTLLVVLVGALYLWPKSQRNLPTNSQSTDFYHVSGLASKFNNTYPLSKPKKTPLGMKYRIGIIADLDENSKSSTMKNTWTSHFKRGYLTVHPDRTISIEWDEKIVVLSSTLSQKGRGMELSELIAFNGKLYAIDDRTGVIFQIMDEHVVPWVILPDGDGTEKKGFKGEWMAVKSKTLYAGGLGKEWTTTEGVFQNHNPQWVKSIGPFGDIVHHNWVPRYDGMRAAMGIAPPGYIIHEAGIWSDVHQLWFFLPRRASHEMYNEKDDEHRATNALISCDEHFKSIHVRTIGKLNPTHGFSSLKFVPGTNDELIVALKTEEDKGVIRSYIMAFNLDGKVVMEETIIGNNKFEGIEFI
ncbi:predicted protein [Nematostella vectensis]|uniref:Soluble calcium-activated nucleotidase 1 n=1 Tax=Nematostella vectensis TaxID=45351 RepID=A7SYE9_NEMVE|nr:soluble calcium-activated nucleotidase 1 [Nematostella vectensis]EDO31276.1 predicted protein [Nematostella vectensis]|eukprot:XP_001623376.1 predicted protein [Nematostella vectensis]